MKLYLLFSLALIVPTLTHAQVVQQPQRVDPRYYANANQFNFDECIKSGPDPESAQRYRTCNDISAEIANRPTYSLRNPYGYPSYVGNYGYGGYSSGYAPFWVDPCQSYLPERSQNVGCTISEIKFKILNRKMGDHVIVRINGQNAGLVSKYSHPNTSGLRLRAEEEYTMVLEWISRDGVRTIEDRISPLAMRHQDGPYWYPVSQEQFANAPFGQNVTVERENVSGKKYIQGEKR